jgi:coenzyme PQQ biosynthesis protein PqqD
MAPERILSLDEIAEEIVKSIDGERTVDTIISKLAADYDATQEEIKADVITLIQVLEQGGYITL